MTRPPIMVVPVLVTLAALLTGTLPAAAHPMPHSAVLLDIKELSVSAQLRLPVEELFLASGTDLRNLDPAGLDAQEAALRKYLGAHTKLTTFDHRLWTVHIGSLSLADDGQTSAGPYPELVAQAEFTPPAGGDMRRFIFGYDVIVHQVVTHDALIAVRQDWASGQVSGDNDAKQVGVIRTDGRTMTVAPLSIDLGSASAWSGFLAMVKLGGRHILEGTDHLLFLLTLPLPAVLQVRSRRWHGVAGTRTAISRIGLITLAFTLEHSAALAVSAFSRLSVPSPPVEVFIAASIAALGWLLDGLGVPNPAARAADTAGSYVTLMLISLTLAAAATGLWMIRPAMRKRHAEAAWQDA